MHCFSFPLTASCRRLAEILLNVVSAFCKYLLCLCRFVLFIWLCVLYRPGSLNPHIRCCSSNFSSPTSILSILHSAFASEHWLHFQFWFVEVLRLHAKFKRSQRENLPPQLLSWLNDYVDFFFSKTRLHLGPMCLGSPAMGSIISLRSVIGLPRSGLFWGALKKFNHTNKHQSLLEGLPFLKSYKLSFRLLKTLWVTDQAEESFVAHSNLSLLRPLNYDGFAKKFAYSVPLFPLILPILWIYSVSLRRH